MSEEIFIKEIEKLGININKDKKEKFYNYFLLLKEYNQKFNLTTIIEEKEVYLKHFYDSATLLMSEKIDNDKEICDVGSGAGFPGVVLKILVPEIKLTLIDSSNKKTDFLKKVVETLQISDVTVVCDRVEDYIKNTNKRYDIVVTRAVAKLNILCELCIPLLKVNGSFISMKAKAEEEIQEAQQAINILNSSIEKTYEFNLPFENSKRTIIIIKKHAESEKKYPRRFSEIKKNPL